MPLNFMFAGNAHNLRAANFTTEAVVDTESEVHSLTESSKL